MNDFRCPNPKHNKKKITSVLMADAVNKPSRFLCFQCQNELLSQSMSQSQLTQESYETQICDLDEIFENDNYSIYNWPSDPIGKGIKQLIAQFQTADQIKSDIEAFFKELKTKVIAQIEATQAIVLEILASSQASNDIMKQKPQQTQTNSKDQDSEDQLIVKLKQIYDEVYDASKLKTIIKENYKSDAALLNGKVNEFLNDAKRRESFAKIKDIYAKLQSGSAGSVFTSNKEEKTNYMNQIISAIQSWDKCYGSLNWKWTVSKADESIKLKAIVSGTQYQGAGEKAQIVYSNQLFTNGQHGCILMMEEYDNNRVAKDGNLFIGLVDENDKDKKGYGFGIRACLFSTNGQGMTNKGSGNNFSNYLRTPHATLNVLIDMDKNVFQITDSKKSILYQLEKDEKIAGQKLRLYLYWNNAADNLKLVHSY